MYSEEQYYKAVALYDEWGSVTKTITQLGYTHVTTPAQTQAASTMSSLLMQASGD